MTKELSYLKLNKKIAYGAFGEIYEAVDTNNNTKIAAKVEKRTTIQQLRHEYSIYNLLACSKIPMVFDYGLIEIKEETMNCMTMELLGPSLEKLFNRQNREFSIKTIFMIAKACINRIEILHHGHFIHRDIKPDNFVCSKNLKNLYLIDYGLCKEYRNPVTLVHRPYKEGKNLTGTARYASLNTHTGIEQSRRDDMESLGFMLVYFFCGRLPWQGIRKYSSKKKKYQKIHYIKKNLSLQKLCEGCPEEIYLYLIAVRNLKYVEYPDYFKLSSLFEEGLVRRNLKDNGVFDWLDPNTASTKVNETTTQITEKGKI